MLQFRSDVIPRLSPVLVFALFAFGCATQPSGPSEAGDSSSGSLGSVAANGPDRVEKQGNFLVNVANILNQPLSARVRLLRTDGTSAGTYEVPDGSGSFRCAAGSYAAYTYAYDDGVPILVDVSPLEVTASDEAELRVSVLEGSSGNRTLRAFDQDFDMALDRIETEQGTDPADALDVPGVKTYRWPSPVLSTEGAWYRGELHAYSRYGPGSESVGRLIRRAESAKLDFLAITDPNTMASAFDPEFSSESLVLIPAMEWGRPETGTALLYAPGIIPGVSQSRAEAQATVVWIQAQGGIFAVAHPVWPEHSWQWGLDYFNAMEVWCGGWRDVAPARLAQLDDRWQERDEAGELKFAIAEAAASNYISANGQSALFYDLVSNRGEKACVIAGSASTGPKVPLGEPVTYIYAREKSLKGMLEGLRKGRTYVSRGLNGPTVEFQADVLNDGSIDTGMGGIIPINKESKFIVGVEGAKGARLEILLNGLPIRSRPIEADKLYYSIPDTPLVFGVYRVRIVETPNENDKGYGFADVLAMTSPIYAQSYIVDPAKGETGGWIDIENGYGTGPEFYPEAINPANVRTLQPNDRIPASEP